MAVNKKLYDLLKNSETGAAEYLDDTFECWVHIDNWNVKDFIEWLQENGDNDQLSMQGYPLHVHVDSIRCDLQMLINLLGHNLSDYKDCFEWWDEYKDKINN